MGRLALLFSLAWTYTRPLIAIEQVCPIGWERLTTRLCRAPVRERRMSSCPSVVDFGSMDSAAKKEFAKRCDERWPEPTCHRDFSHPCFQDWTPVGRGQCRAPASYSGPCPRVLDLSFHSNEMKRAISYDCEAAFPCFELNEPDVRQCPLRWRLVETTETGNLVCRPPAVYVDNRGPCSNGDQVLPIGISDRIRWADDCSVAFPPLETCEKDYFPKCPTGWRYKMGLKGKCIAPAAYAGACPRVQSFSFWNPDAKARWAAICHADWPCKDGRQLRKWQAACPKGWRRKLSLPLIRRHPLRRVKKNICVPPKKYRGPCQGPQDLTQYTFAMKEAFSAKCKGITTRIYALRKCQCSSVASKRCDWRVESIPHLPTEDYARP